MRNIALLASLLLASTAYGIPRPPLWPDYLHGTVHTDQADYATTAWWQRSPDGLDLFSELIPWTDTFVEFQAIPFADDWQLLDTWIEEGG